MQAETFNREGKGLANLNVQKIVPLRLRYIKSHLTSTLKFSFRKVLLKYISYHWCNFDTNLPAL